MKIPVFLFSLLLLISCGPPEVKFSSYDLGQKDGLRHSDTDAEKIWRLEGKMNGDLWEIDCGTFFEKRWIRNKPQWIPTEFSYTWGATAAHSKGSLLLVPYAPKLKPKFNEEDFLEYEMTLMVFVAPQTSSRYEMLIMGRHNYFLSVPDLDSIDQQEFGPFEISGVDYQNIDTASGGPILKTFYCRNTKEGLHIEDKKSALRSLEALSKIPDMGHRVFKEKTNFIDSLPIGNPEMASYTTITEVREGIRNYGGKYYSLPEWLKERGLKVDSLLEKL